MTTFTMINNKIIKK